MADKNYDLVARVYDTLGLIYSGGQIHAAKNSQLGEMQAGDRVLYVGVGPGEDAVLAAQRGARVTCLDLSAQMLLQAKARMQRHGCDAEFLQADVLQHDRQNYYDVVVVNFFLNVFSEGQMRDMLAYLVTLVRPAGKLLISDFATPQGNSLGAACRRPTGALPTCFTTCWVFAPGIRSTITPAIFRTWASSCARKSGFGRTRSVRAGSRP